MVGLFTPGAHFTRRISTLALPSPSPGYPGWCSGPIKTEYKRLLEDFDELTDIITCKYIFSFWVYFEGDLRAGSFNKAFGLFAVPLFVDFTTGSLAARPTESALNSSQE